MWHWWARVLGEALLVLLVTSSLGITLFGEETG